MAGFLQVGGRLINMDNVNYISLDEGIEHKVVMCFNGAASLELTGAEADEIRNRLRELDVVDRLPFFQNI